MKVYQVSIVINAIDDDGRVTLGVTTDPHKAMDMARLTYGISQDAWKKILDFYYVQQIRVEVNVYEENRVQTALKDDSDTSMILMNINESEDFKWYVANDYTEEMEEMLCSD